MSAYPVLDCRPPEPGETFDYPVGSHPNGYLVRITCQRSANPGFPIRYTYAVLNADGGWLDTNRSGESLDTAEDAMDRAVTWINGYEAGKEVRRLR